MRRQQRQHNSGRRARARRGKARLRAWRKAARRSLNGFTLAAVTFVVGMALGSLASLWSDGEPAPQAELVTLERTAPVAQPASPPLAAPRVAVEVETLPPLPTAEAPPAPEIVHAPDFADLPGQPDAAPPEAEPRTAAWQTNAVQLAALPDGPAIALVIDDVGLSRPGAKRAIALPAPVTLALMTYAEGLPSLAEQARAAGHELLVHMPMQPIDEEYNPGPNVLKADLPEEELLARIAWGLDRFAGYVGVNNHMGSRFTTDPDGMALVMTALKERGLMFLDSRTVGNSLGEAAARGAGVPTVSRDIFLDHEQTPEFVGAQLRRLEDIALRRGFAIGIGHPHAVTLEALERWIPAAKARGIGLVPITAILDLQEKRNLAAKVAEPAG